MREEMRVKRIQEFVDKPLPIFITNDGKEYSKQEDAEEHEEFLRLYPRLSKSDLEWVEGFKKHSAFSNYDEEYEDFEKILNSNNSVIILMDHSGGDDPFYITVDPVLKAVQAIIKALHRKAIGCNYNVYVYGVVYNGESLCLKGPDSIDGSRLI